MIQEGDQEVADEALDYWTPYMNTDFLQLAKKMMASLVEAVQEIRNMSF